MPGCTERASNDILCVLRPFNGMRKLIISVLTLVFAGCSGAAPSPILQPAAANAALSWRFIGLDALKTETNLVVFRQASGLPEFEGFKSNLTVRIAESFAKAATPTN